MRRHGTMALLVFAVISAGCGEDRPPVTAEELLEHYETGGREFPDVQLRNANLRKATLTGVNLIQALQSLPGMGQSSQQEPEEE